MFKIYGRFTPMYLKTVLAAEEMSLAYETLPIDLFKGEHRTPEHLSRHPFGKVPVLEHEGRYVFESNAIIRYMANVSDSPLYPREPYSRAMVDQWMDYFSLQAGRWVTTAWFERCLAPKYFGREPDTHFVDHAIEQLLLAMPTVENHLTSHEYLAGPQMSLADINAYMLMQGWKDANLAFDDFPNFVRWFKEIDQRETTKRAWTRR